MTAVLTSNCNEHLARVACAIAQGPPRKEREPVQHDHLGRRTRRREFLTSDACATQGLAWFPPLKKAVGGRISWSLHSGIANSLPPINVGYGKDPTIFREGSFRFFFFSREESRMHVHVSHPDGEAKFWLTPALALATSAGLSPKQLKEAEKIVAVHLEEIDHAWRTHFPG